MCVSYARGDDLEGAVKAVILAGGQGTRLRPITHATPKQLIPVGGVPVLGHVIDSIADCGIDEVIVITSPEAADQVGGFAKSYRSDLDVSVLLQESPNGLAAAYAMAMPAIGDDPSLLFLGDCVVTGGIKHVVESHQNQSADATLLVHEVDDPRRYGIVELDDAGRITALVEKPAQPKSNLAIVGVYAFSARIAESVRSIRPSARGEYEITDAIQHLVDSGGTARAASLNGWWADTGTVADILATHVKLLSASTSHGDGIAVHPGATIENTTLEGPVVVDEGAIVIGATVRGGTHISAGASVRGATIAKSIIMEGATIDSVDLADSIVGPHSLVKGRPNGRATTVVISADSVVQF